MSRFDSWPVKLVFYDPFATSGEFAQCAPNDPAIAGYGVYEGKPGAWVHLCDVTDPEDAAQLVNRLTTMYDALSTAHAALTYDTSFARATDAVFKALKIPT